MGRKKDALSEDHAAVLLQQSTIENCAGKDEEKWIG